jgi:hypothetical protein
MQAGLALIAENHSPVPVFYKIGKGSLPNHLPTTACGKAITAPACGQRRQLLGGRVALPQWQLWA